MPRIPYPDPATLSEEEKAMIAGTPINIVRMAAHAHPMYTAAQAKLSYAGANPEVIDRKLREVVVLRVAKLEDSAYEMHQHYTLAQSAGWSEQNVKDILAGDYSKLEPVHATAAQFADELVAEGNVTDETLARMRSLVDDRTLVTMTMIIGQYISLARLIAVTGPDLDEQVLVTLPKSATDRFETQ